MTSSYFCENTMKAQIVIGSNFGDEGKGMTVDYLASLDESSIVVRFNGGANAGHTVHTPDCMHHIFSHFGSGTLLGRPTYLSKHFVVDPSAFVRECMKLVKLPVGCPKVFVDGNAYLATPFDVLINHVVEMARGEDRHGSCGFGINETVTRNLNSPGIATTVNDLLSPNDLRRKLLNIRYWYVNKRLEQLGVDYSDNVIHDNIIDEYMEQCAIVLENIRIVSSPEFLKNYETVIFEGAQGLLLDEHHRWFPHVTRSRTGIYNAVNILKEIGVTEAEVYYVSRSYLTRHGNGPLPNEVIGTIYEKITDPTNIPNKHQGSLRFAPLNFQLIQESIFNDLATVDGMTLYVNFVLTCVNQLPTFGVSYVNVDGELVTDTTPVSLLNEINNLYPFVGCMASLGRTRVSFHQL